MPTKCGDPLCPCQDGDPCHYVDWGDTKAMMVSKTQHEKNLRGMRCVVCESTIVSLHHCHGGSMNMVEGLPNPGMGQRANPFLQIPLHPDYHFGAFGIDTGMGSIKTVEQWEDAFGSQIEMLHEVNETLGYDLWGQARKWEAANR